MCSHTERLDGPYWGITGVVTVVSFWKITTTKASFRSSGRGGLGGWKPAASLPLAPMLVYRADPSRFGFGGRRSGIVQGHTSVEGRHLAGRNRPVTGTPYCTVDGWQGDARLATRRDAGFAPLSSVGEPLTLVVSWCHGGV